MVRVHVGRAHESVKLALANLSLELQLSEPKTGPARSYPLALIGAAPLRLGTYAGRGPAVTSVASAAASPSGTRTWRSLATDFFSAVTKHLPTLGKAHIDVDWLGRLQLTSAGSKNVGFLGGDCGGAVLCVWASEEPMLGVFDSEISIRSCRHNRSYTSKLEELAEGHFVSFARDPDTGRHTAAVYYISQFVAKRSESVPDPTDEKAPPLSYLRNIRDRKWADRSTAGELRALLEAQAAEGLRPWTRPGLQQLAMTQVRFS